MVNASIVDYAARKAFTPTKRKYQYLLEDVDVRRWHDDVSRGASVTADVCLRRLGSFCQSKFMVNCIHSLVLLLRVREFRKVGFCLNPNENHIYDFTMLEILWNKKE
jgi:hypothetical protein